MNQPDDLDAGLFQAASAKTKAQFGKSTDDKAVAAQQRRAAEQMDLTALLGIEQQASSGTGLDFADSKKPVPAKALASAIAPPPSKSQSQPAATQAAAPARQEPAAAPVRRGFFARLLALFRR